MHSIFNYTQCLRWCFSSSNFHWIAKPIIAKFADIYFHWLRNYARKYSVIIIVFLFSIKMYYILKQKCTRLTNKQLYTLIKNLCNRKIVFKLVFLFDLHITCSWEFWNSTWHDHRNFVMHEISTMTNISYIFRSIPLL